MGKRVRRTVRSSLTFKQRVDRMRKVVNAELADIETVEEQYLVLQRTKKYMDKLTVTMEAYF